MSSHLVSGCVDTVSTANTASYSDEVETILAQNRKRTFSTMQEDLIHQSGPSALKALVSHETYKCKMQKARAEHAYIPRNTYTVPKDFTKTATKRMQ